MSAIKRFIARLGLAVLLAPWASIAPAQTVEYLHTDALGSVVAVTDAGRNIVERREYEPYGYQLTPAAQNGPGYTGHVQDAATGLTYMQQRYYDPVLGRFLSVDPVTMHDSGDARHFNRYGYANNNPYTFVDPDGRQSRLLLPPPPLVAVPASVPPPGYPDASNDVDWSNANRAAAESASEALVAAGGSAAILARTILKEVLPSVLSSESPEIDPGSVAGGTPDEIDGIAREAGLIPRGSDPSSGRGSYVDPVTGKQRILVHPVANCGPHCHVNDADGNRLDVNGNRVPPESPEAHLPLGRGN